MPGLEDVSEHIPIYFQYRAMFTKQLQELRSRLADNNIDQEEYNVQMRILSDNMRGQTAYMAKLMHRELGCLMDYM